MAPEPLGIGPEEMVGVTTVGGAGHVQWAEVAEVELQGLGSEGGEPTRHLLVRLKDGGGERFDLPPMSEDEFGQLWAVLETVAGRHGFAVGGIEGVRDALLSLQPWPRSRKLVASTGHRPQVPGPVSC